MAILAAKLSSIALCLQKGYPRQRPNAMHIDADLAECLYHLIAIESAALCHVVQSLLQYWEKSFGRIRYGEDTGYQGPWWNAEWI